jgi:hypothetical protein
MFYKEEGGAQRGIKWIEWIFFGRKAGGDN